MSLKENTETTVSELNDQNEQIEQTEADILQTTNTEHDDLDFADLELDDIQNDEYDNPDDFTADDLQPQVVDIHFDEANNWKYSALLLADKFLLKQIHYISLRIIVKDDVYIFEEAKGMFGNEQEEKEQVTGDLETLTDLVDIFKSKYNTYTTLEWGSSEVNHDSQYKELHSSSAGENHESKRKPLADLEILPSHLDESVQQMISVLVPKDDILLSWKKESSNDHMKLRDSWLSKETIKEGLSILGNIVRKIESRMVGSTDVTTESYKFYLLVPLKSKYAEPVVFSNVVSVRKRMRVLEEKFEIDHKESKMELVSGEERIRVGDDFLLHPYDTKYLSFNCDITTLDKEAPDYLLLDEYFETTGSPGFKVVNSFKCRRRSENTPLQGKCRLLWHGSSPVNLCGIMREGLRITPNSCNAIYLADCAAKSLGYSHGYGRNCFLFLCDVLVGENLLEANWNNYSRDSGIVKYALGTLENPKVSVCNSGSEVHVGKPLGGHSEYLVFDEKKINLAYLMQVQCPH